MTSEQIDPIGILAQVLRERLDRGEVVIPSLRAFMDDLRPGWSQEHTEPEVAG